MLTKYIARPNNFDILWPIVVLNLKRMDTNEFACSNFINGWAYKKIMIK